MKAIVITFAHRLFDLERDPRQQNLVADAGVEDRL